MPSYLISTPPWNGQYSWNIFLITGEFKLFIQYYPVPILKLYLGSGTCLFPYYIIHFWLKRLITRISIILQMFWEGKFEYVMLCQKIICGLVLDIFLHHLWTSNVGGATCPPYVKLYGNQQLVNLPMYKVTFYLWIALCLGDCNKDWSKDKFILGRSYLQYRTVNYKLYDSTVPSDKKLS